MDLVDGVSDGEVSFSFAAESTSVFLHESNDDRATAAVVVVVAA